MRLRQFFYGAWALLLMVGLLGCGTEPVNQADPAAANETKVYRWKLITTWPKNLPGLGVAPERLAQGIQFPLVELQTQCEMLRALIHKTAWQMDTYGAFSVSDKVSMCNYWSNRLCCEAADRAMQVHGGLGYSRHKPFEHIYRHHRRYRITEGAEEIQMRRVAGYLFGFMSQRAPKGVKES